MDVGKDIVEVENPPKSETWVLRLLNAGAGVKLKSVAEGRR